MNDQSGPYRDDTGPLGVLCVKQAVEEFTAGKDMKVEVLSADHQNKPDIGAGVARQWFAAEDTRQASLARKIVRPHVSALCLR